MDFTSSLIQSISDLPDNESADSRYDLLDWISESDFLKLRVQERELQVHEKYYRFAVQGELSDNTSLFGYGRSPNRQVAATIAVNEVLERFVARKVLNARSVLAPFGITVENGDFTIRNSKDNSPLPTQGFHSSNGWAVHFSVRAAIENAMREALERHILLLSYFKHGWAGFLYDEAVPFSGCQLIPGIARVTAGGYKAGIVLTNGPEAKGMTFGYLCGAGSEFEKSNRWLGAFFESYEQWIDLAPLDVPRATSVIEQYQWHYLKAERPLLPKEPVDEASFPRLQGKLAVFDLRKAFRSPFPLYAAFVFGGDFLPLFLRQNLSRQEMEGLQMQLAKNGVVTDIPEYHPIL